MAENKEVKYNEPWILQRADPFVCKRMVGIILRHQYQVTIV